ncbi:MAG: sigma 54-interacting transcriptional regulator [Clostridium sp.]|nr:sigma 54-interacting transcriptional regulator [Clostridium sp.]
MLRIEMIRNYIYKFCSNLTAEDIINNPYIGISSLDISENLDILRNNASSDLNKLHKDGILIKIKGKPTKYFYKDHLEQLFNLNLFDSSIECLSLNELIDIQENDIKFDSILPKKKDTDPFSKLIGASNSLMSIVKLAKSSILYPGGLHTLLLGESGVGKSLFAELMYEYGLINNIFSKDSSFVVFNCADYANNPNLLVSQLFGSVKGAYTGAESDKKGLIEEANNGVLFLDEIHRLPPEGQEMLFLYIDKKKFRRLGEVSSERTSNVLIIAATTENPNSMLLTTFIRRIPAIVKIPNLNDRSLSEKLMLVTSLYDNEARKVNMPIIASKDCLSDLMLYNPKGNIGQLSSDIQLSVARAYLDSKMNNLDKVYITKESLPLYTSNTLTNIDISTRQKVELLLDKDEYRFLPKLDFKKNINTPSYDFIKFFNTQFEENKDLKKAFSDYTQLIAKSFVLENIFPDFIDDEISEIVSTLSDILYEDLNLIIDKSSYIALALYLKNLKDYDNINSTPTALELSEISSEIKNISKKLIKILEGRFNIYCPTSELNNLMVIIDSLKSKEIFEPVGVMIAAHGDSIATDIANVANDLLSINFALSVDMPLTENPNNILSLIIEKLKGKSFKRGLILFADMGSLTNLDESIKKETGINVVTLQSINILLVIEAIRKSIFLKNDLEDILHDLLWANNKLNYSFNKKIENYLSINKKNVIYTVCNSGEGIANYLKKSIEDLLKTNNIFNVEIIPLSIENKKKLRDIIKQTSIDKRALAIIGSVNPDNSDIPFISLEDILLNSGINKLLNILGIKEKPSSNKIVKSITKEISIDITCDAVNKYLTILSGDKIKYHILEFINIIETELNIDIANSSLSKIFIHVSCVIERILLKDFVLTSHEEISSYKKKNEKYISLIQKAFVSIIDTFNISIPDNELYFICEIIKEAERESKI